MDVHTNIKDVTVLLCLYDEKDLHSSFHKGTSLKSGKRGKKQITLQRGSERLLESS